MNPTESTGTTTTTRKRRQRPNGATLRNEAGRETRPRVRGSARGDEASNREAQYDLLTAALVGLAIGAGTTLLLRRGPGGGRPITPAWRMARAGAKMAGRGARFAWDRGVDAWERMPRDEIEERVRSYFDSARETLDDLVHSELRDLRRAIRRRRKKLGL